MNIRDDKRIYFDSDTYAYEPAPIKPAMRPYDRNDTLADDLAPLERDRIRRLVEVATVRVTT